MMERMQIWVADLGSQSSEILQSLTKVCHDLFGLVFRSINPSRVTQGKRPQSQE